MARRKSARDRAESVLQLGSVSPTLDTFSQHFFDDALPEALSMRSFEAFDRSRYSAEVLLQGRLDWELRTLDEYRSQVAFTEFLLELTEVGFAFDVLNTAVRLVRDEARHTELCRRMVHALGGNDTIPGEPNWVRSDPEQPMQLRALSTLTHSLCIGETISVALLAAVRARTEDPLAHAVLTCLCADESIHSRFGWTLLETWAPDLKKSERNWISSQLPAVLSTVERAVVDPTPPESEPEGPFGTLSWADRARVFEKSITQDVVTRFESLGFPAKKAWDKRRS
jgi:hypothetical protein